VLPLKRYFRIGYREAKGHALIAAAISWLLTLAFVFIGRGDRSVFGPLKWSDFVHFYTLGDIARTRNTSLLYAGPAQHARQVELVPDSASDGFVPIYGPQTALVFAPLSRLPYLTAGLGWALVTMAVYAWAVWLAWRPARDAIKDRVFVVAAALAFPPVWQLCASGQTTALILVAFVAAWRALEANQLMLAGVSLSLLAIKPQFGLVLAPVAILAREWRLIAGVVIGIVVQILAVIVVFGLSALIEYAKVIRRIPTMTALLEPSAYKMHSLNALTHLLPPHVDLAVWSVLLAVIVALTTAVWRQAHPWRLRVGVLVLASALINPHLTIYDVTVIALPIIWIGGWLVGLPGDTTWFWQRVYWISVALLIPTAVLVKVQVSTILLAELYLRTVRIASRSGDYT
jgi:hypothetical protein